MLPPPRIAEATWKAHSAVGGTKVKEGAKAIQTPFVISGVDQVRKMIVLVGPALLRVLVMRVRVFDTSTVVGEGPRRRFVSGKIH